MGWTEACSLNRDQHGVVDMEGYRTHCNFGKLCTRRCTSLPAFWRLRSSPISCGVYKENQRRTLRLRSRLPGRNNDPRAKSECVRKQGSGNNGGTHELLCFCPSNDVGRDTLELPQRRHRTPPTTRSASDDRMSYFLSDLHPTFNHLAQGESAFCRNGPRTFQADFVDSAQDPEKINRSLKRWQGEKKQNSPPGGLLDVHHVRDEGKALKFQPGNISL